MSYDFQIIANLMAGKGEAKKKLASLKKFLDENKQTYRVLEIDKPTPISLLPADGRTAIQKAVICLGGDGTVSETLGYIFNHKIEVPLAVVPTGTANIVVNTLGLNKNVGFDFLLKSNTKEIDVGLADYGQEKKYFLLGVGMGFEERFLKLSKDKMKSKFGIISYVLAALAELLSLKKIPLTVISEDKEQKINCCLLTVFNLQPVIFKAFPLFNNGEIKCDDGLLNLYYVNYKSYLMAFLGTLLFHLLGKRNLGLVRMISGKEFKINSDAVVGTQIDGELRGNLPVSISLFEKKCRFLI